MRERLTRVFPRLTTLLFLVIGFHGCGFDRPIRCIVARSPDSEWRITAKEITRRLVPMGYFLVEISRAGEPGTVIYPPRGGDFEQICTFEMEWSKDSSAFVLWIWGCSSPAETIAYSIREGRLSQHRELENTLFRRLGRRYHVPGTQRDVMRAISETQEGLAFRRALETTNYPARCLEYDIAMDNHKKAR